MRDLQVLVRVVGERDGQVRRVVDVEQHRLDPAVRPIKEHVLGVGAARARAAA